MSSHCDGHDYVFLMRHLLSLLQAASCRDSPVTMATIPLLGNNVSAALASAAESAAGGALSRAGHTAAAVVLGFVLVLGFLENLLVLLVFSRFPQLQSPVNLLLVNISASDMLVCLFGTPLSFAANVRGRWLTGASGCRWYGFCNSLFGERPLQDG